MDIPILHRTCLGCTKCQLLPPDVREALDSPKKLSILQLAPRFGDMEKSLTLDGQNIAGDASEVMLGAVGWALRYHVNEGAGAFHTCPFCNDNVCVYVQKGHVAIDASTKPTMLTLIHDPNTDAALRALFDA